MQQWFALACIRDWWSVAHRSADDAILSRYPAGPTSFRVTGIDADTCRCETRLFSLMNTLALVAKMSGRFRGHTDRGFHRDAPSFCLGQPSWILQEVLVSWIFIYLSGVWLHCEN